MKSIEKLKNNQYLNHILVILYLLFVAGVATICDINKFALTFFIITVIGITLGTFIVLLSLVINRKEQNILLVVLDLLIIVILYSLAYLCIYSFDKNAFKIPYKGVPYLDFLYYSFVTFTTLGYGDIQPVSYVAKFVSVSEAFLFTGVISIGVISFSNGVRKYLKIYDKI